MMAVIHALHVGDPVELTVPIGPAPAGARGGVLEIRDDTAMIEVMTMPLEAGIDRIVYAPLEKLRALPPGRHW
jgi:hypothetical protein